MTDAGPAGWFARTDGQAAFQGSAFEEKTPALVHAEINLSGLGEHAGAARVVFDDAALTDGAATTGESDRLLLRRRLHEHLDRALDAAEISADVRPGHT
ncbi:hypothetical protein [Kineococcus sp. NPDC059986]|uniref:hypothetical protein n=1 Tax=Kineococcus sp. NPDC059986 TaxID=3155538 RepID=UPI00344B5C15